MINEKLLQNTGLYYLAVGRLKAAEHVLHQHKKTKIAYSIIDSLIREGDMDLEGALRLAIENCIDIQTLIKTAIKLK